MKLVDVLARFGSREEMARWCGATVDSTYKWAPGDDGRVVSREIRCRIVMGLVLKLAHEARASGQELDESDAALLAEDLEGVASERDA